MLARRQSENGEKMKEADSHETGKRQYLQATYAAITTIKKRI